MASGGSAPDVPGLYMVDATFPDPKQLPAWLEWYRRHIDMLLREVSTFLAAQRYRALDPEDPDFLGVYALSSGGMFTSAEYLSRGGQYPAEWLDYVRDWYRGFYTGAEMPTEVRPGEVLMVTDKTPAEAAPLGINFTWLKGAGLQPRAPQRGLAVVAEKEGARIVASYPNLVRAFLPITPLQTKP